MEKWTETDERKTGEGVNIIMKLSRQLSFMALSNVRNNEILRIDTCAGEEKAGIPSLIRNEIAI